MNSIFFVLMQHVRKSGAKPCNYYVSDTFYSLMSVTFLRVSDLLWLLLLLFCTCFPDFHKWSLTFPYFRIPKLTMQEHHNATKWNCYKLIERRHHESGWEIIMKLIFAVIFHGLFLTCLIFFYLLSDSMLRTADIVYIFIMFPLRKFPFPATRKIPLASPSAVSSPSRQSF